MGRGVRGVAPQVEKREQFARLIAQGVSNRRACQIVGHRAQDRDTLAVGAHNHHAGRPEAALSACDQQAHLSGHRVVCETSMHAVASNWWHPGWLAPGWSLAGRTRQVGTGHADG